MSINNKLVVDSSSIIPMISSNQTQLIFQRHCDYDRLNGNLTMESIDKQKEIVTLFINYLSNNYSTDELQNTYFLFASSNTTSSGDFKRCVETTNIAMEGIRDFLISRGISLEHIMNLNPSSNYNYNIHEDKYLTEPKMFTDSTGYFEFLKQKHNGINKDFWIDFEEDLSKDVREELEAEGPDEIVNRCIRYIRTLQRYSCLFKLKNPNNRLIIWNGTHYDVISPLVKQRILNWEKSDIVNVNYCGGISLILSDDNDIVANVNQTNYPFDSQYSKQLHRHF